MKSLLPALGALVLAGAGVTVTSAPAWSAGETCGTQAATLVVPADQGAAPFEGTAGDDVIYVTGTATVRGLAGNDVICGPTGAPATTGGQWNGGDGNDTLTSTSASLEGGDGTDTLTGGGTTIDGGAGNDVVRGGNGDNTVLGGAGDDQLWGGSGIDTLDGGDGTDVVHATARDRIRVGGPARTTIDVTAHTIEGPGGRDTYTGSPMIWAPGATDETLIGSNRADVFTSEGGADNVYGLGGDDRLTAVQPTRLEGGPGDDQITVAFGGRVRAGAGDDRVRTVLSTDDHPGVAAQPFNLEGNTGDDVLYAASLTTAGAIVSPTPGNQLWSGTVRGGGGWDRVVFTPTKQAVTADLTTGQATWAGGSMTLSGVQAMWGTPGDDVLTGSGGRNGLLGGAGDDHLNGGGGRDDLRGASGFDTTNGGTAIDRCRGEVKVACER
jgi:Ca2+-binding RTX toxin-like protein